MNKHIVFVSSNYPSTARPHCGVFVNQLLRNISKMGVKCSVINPVSIFDRRYGRLDPEVSYESDSDGNKVQVLRPRYISFSSKKILSFNTDYLTQWSFLNSVFRALPLLDQSPDVLYGHFLYPGGAAAVKAASKLGIPSIVAVGESSFWSVEPLGFERAICDFKDIGGVVSVSSLIKKNIVHKLHIDENRIRVFPNGVDFSRVYPRNRDEMREKHSLPADQFIISFIGHFDERKGPHRLLSAVSGLENTGLLFIGNGKIKLEDRNILFKGTVDHTVIPELLSASDLFVLPTLEEGSCNSIVEAMACGLPVVTSEGEFNDDIVDNDVAIRVDPENIDEIRNAISTLKEDRGLRKTMSEKAVIKAADLDINKRAQNIIGWIDEVSERQKNESVTAS